MTQSVKVVVHLLVWSLAAYLAFRFCRVPLHSDGAIAFFAALILIKLGLAILQSSFREVWRHTSLPDLAALLQSSAMTAAILSCAVLTYSTLPAPRLALVDGALTLALLGGLRLTPRVLTEVVRPALCRQRRRVILAGRSDRVELELRRMDLRPSPTDRVVGLVVDAPELVGARLHRRAVMTEAQLERMMVRRQIAEVILVQPSSAAFTARVEQLSARHRVRNRSVASLLPLGQWIEASELLDRDPVDFDVAAVTPAVTRRHVLITGAAGSIGSELVRQLLALKPARLVLVDRWENGLFQLEAELAARYPSVPALTLLADVRDQAAMSRIFKAHSIDIVFHAAAHKHVPLVERNVTEAILNNVAGTRNMVQLADAVGVDAFVYISTDKAVQPASVMGASKRIGELMVKAMSARSTTRFVSVRFGNVLGSNGSVLPLFIEQIQRGGPVTVTHQDMCRYFMSTGEACQLVLRALALGRSGELYVLHMGEPVRILDLARRLIERAGLRPGVDVPIVFDGPRPGEKLAERLTGLGERVLPTEHPRLLCVEVGDVAWTQLAGRLDALEEAARRGDELETLAWLIKLVPEYRAPSAWSAAAPMAQEAG
jgi:FlaA1/EpsC-like NDP-sugar epimerase